MTTQGRGLGHRISAAWMRPGDLSVFRRCLPSSMRMSLDV